MKNFRDIVTNFSIGAISKSKVGFYAKRLSKETATRRLASALMIGLLVFQIVTFLAPPQKSSASGSDIVPGGFSSINQLLGHYDSNAGHIHDILNSLGITREDLASATGATWTCVPGLLSMGYGGTGAASVNGTTVGPCSARWAQGSIGGIKLTRKVYADIGVAGPQWYEIGLLSSCDNLVFLPTSPPAQEQTVSCSNVGVSASTVVVGQQVILTGEASGQNLAGGTLVDMAYGAYDSGTNNLTGATGGNPQLSNGIPPDGGGNFIDNSNKSFSFSQPGTYDIRLLVAYNSNGTKVFAAGSAVGACTKTITVGSQRALVCAQLDTVSKTGAAPFTPGLKGTTRVVGDSGATPFPAKFTYILLHKYSGALAPGLPVINYNGTNYLEGNPTGGPSRIEHANANPAVYIDPAPPTAAFFATDFKQDSPGEFLIILRATDQNGVATPENPSNCYLPFTVTPPPSNFVCNGLTAAPGSGLAPLADVVLTATAGVNNATVQSYNFDFGDGNKQTVSTGALTASSAKHTYSNPGTYTSTVTITTNKGSTNPNSCKAIVTVQPPTFICKNLTASPTTGPIPLDVTFTAQATVAGAKVQSYIFDYGDGSAKQTVNSNQTTAQSKHSYSSPGKFTASVVIQTDKGTTPAKSDCQLPISPTDVRYTKTVSNLTLLTANGQPTDANNQVAKAGDTLRYQIAVCNASGAVEKGFVFDDDITDVLYYADVVDLGGAKKVVSNGQTHLVWPAADIPPLATGKACVDGSGNIIVANYADAVRTFTVKVKDPIPASPGAAADTTAYDCKIQDVFHGSVVVTPIGVIPAKQFECAVKQLPQTGAGLPLAFIGFFAASSLYLFFRNRLLRRELQLVETLSEGDNTHV